ncbi:MAG: hypothetical protein ACREDT_04900 [Methylocella sp.]
MMLFNMRTYTKVSLVPFIISLSLLAGTAAHAQSVSIVAWNPTYKSPTPLVSLHIPRGPPKGGTPTYSYEPSAMQDTGPGLKVWFCGGADFGDDPKAYASNFGDSIYYAVINISGGGYYQSPKAVLRHTNNDVDEDGRGACAPSVIRHADPSMQNGANLYLLYYECARRFYDLGHNMGPANGFTQTCLAVSQDGVNWERYNANNWSASHTFGGPATPVLSANPQILKKCAYQLQDGNHTLDTTTTSKDATTGKTSLTCAGVATASVYGVGHPSATTVPVGSSSQVQLYYTDSSTDWKSHGVYVATSLDGIHFDSPRKTNLPNGATVKYYNGDFNGAPGAYIAAIASKHNYLFYSIDGLQFSPLNVKGIDLGGFDLGVAVSSHCTAPGTPGIVADQGGNISSLNSINIISGEGYLGTADNGPKLGCYNQAEDKINRGSTFKLYRMEGSLSLLSPSSSIPAGFYRVTDGTPIYFSTGQDNYCQMADWQSYLWAGGSSDLSNVTDVASVTPVMVNSGVCGFPSGYFMVTGDKTIYSSYSSNGQSAYCSFPSSRAFHAKGGKSDLSNVWQVTVIPPNMQNNGVCK